MNRHQLTLSRAALILFAAVAATSSMAAVCQDVTFSLINQSAGPIQVVAVRYRDLDSNDTARRWEQNVTDFSCPSGFLCTTDPRNLGSATRPRRNHELTDIQFHHSHLDQFGAWLAPVWSSANVPSTMTCTDNRNYGAFDVN